MFLSDYYIDGSLWPCAGGDNKNTYRAEATTYGSEPYLTRWVSDIKPTSSASIKPDGGVYYIKNEYNLISLDYEGDELWNWYSGDGYEVESTPAIDKDGTVYIGDYDFNDLSTGGVRAITSNGSQKWYEDWMGGVQSPLKITSDGKLLGGTNRSTKDYFNTYFFGIDLDGDDGWSYSSHDGMTRGQCAIGEDDWSYFYCGGYYDEEQALYAFNENGNLEWKRNMPYSECGVPSIDDDYNIYLPTEDGLYSLTKDKELRWSNNVSYLTYVSIGFDGMLYSTYKDTLYAMESDDGSVAWSKDLDGTTIGEPVVISHDGYLYISMRYKTNKYDSSGELLWSFNYNTALPNNVSIGGDGDIYIPGDGMNCVESPKEWSAPSAVRGVV